MSEEIKNILEKAREASRLVNLLSAEKINQVLCRIADAAVENTDKILKANAEDLARMDKNDPKYDRLLLTRERIAAISEDMRKVAGLQSPLGKVLAEWTQPNGMKISKVSVPFGVVGVIYEARPNVTFDVLSLCLKSGSAVIMKGGTDAYNSNTAITDVIHSVLREEGVSEAVATLFPPSHEATAELLNAVGYVDLIIPRGGRGLINFVRDNSRVPVIETGAGICHAYFHSSGDLTKGAAIVNNAKTRRVSVCNALDCLLIDRDRLADLPALVAPMAEKNVIIYADEDAFNALHGNYPHVEHATEDNWGTEYMDYKMSVKTVAGIDEALAHIATHSSKHSECIVAECADAQARFGKEVDAACVYANVPTSFTDGGQFGFGAEIGISTQKLHARGPMGLPEITTYKYIITGDGQIRNS
ncbi:MAG: glutamate-5-semialdehyde dehydrogenase [Muribaculaceae bacterium]|nr:glutamate-5-semialdehyde dehydrogenase [Muribaculaceae bacterium]MEE1337346.1 glutamate-5-semialdehyde dehydrogenase [Muribaculaceae bacterium]